MTNTVTEKHTYTVKVRLAWGGGGTDVQVFVGDQSVSKGRPFSSSGDPRNGDSGNYTETIGTITI